MRILAIDDMHRKGFFRENLEAICFSVILVLFFKTFVGQQFTIPSPSMCNTLMVGDHLLANKFIYGVPQWSWEENLFPMRSVRRGDIVIFRYPFDRNVDYVKRCIGLPGDRIQICDKHLYVNGHFVTGKWEYYVVHNQLTGGPWSLALQKNMLETFSDQTSRNILDTLNNKYVRDNMSCIVVPDGCIFVMGDNRDNSADSRYWGFVPIDHLRGRPFIIWWSYRGLDNEYTSTTVSNNLKDIFSNTLLACRHFVGRTRWDRIGYLPD